jgi:hypothetical protein
VVLVEEVEETVVALSEVAEVALLALAALDEVVVEEPPVTVAGMYL